MRQSATGHRSNVSGRRNSRVEHVSRTRRISSRSRGRLVVLAVLGAIAGAVALTVILLPSVDPPPVAWHASGPDQPAATVLNGPAPLKVTREIRRELLQTARIFIETSVRRDHPVRSWQYVDPSLRQGLTRAEWRTGNIPVVPFPAASVSYWKIDEANVRDVLLEMMLVPKPGSGLVSKTFLIDLRHSDGPRRWLVASWTPFGVSESQMALDAEARGDNLATVRSRHLSSAWLLIPLSLLSLTLLTPALVFLVDAARGRRAEALYRKKLRVTSESDVTSNSSPS
jgi:hypothetical protein